MSNQRVHGTTHERVDYRREAEKLKLQPIGGRLPYPFVDEELHKVARDAYVSWESKERLFTGGGLPRPGSFTPDSRSLVYTENAPKTGTDLWVLPLEGAEAHKPHIFLQTPFSETTSSLSPDGRWLAYLSNESGRNEVYVQPFPGPGGKWQISTEGGIGLQWLPKGNELFYRAGRSNENSAGLNLPSPTPDNAMEAASDFGRPFAANELTDIFQTVRVSRKVNVLMDDRKDVYCSFQEQI